MLDALFTLLIEPLIYIIELVFSLAYKIILSPGIAIIVVSIAVNLLCLPLYRMADAKQDAQRAKQKSMEKWVSHIKQHFQGDEQYLILSTYYRQQHYSQLSQLNGSLSLLLQVPIFIAAYQFLSDLTLLQGEHFLFIRDLGAPDALFSVGGMAINVLPIVMTLLNVVSSSVYTRGLPLRDKVQTYGLAILFLVLLYNSPAGLVLYWTCNQVFSLAKNVITKLVPNPHRTVVILGEAALAVTFVALLASGMLDKTRKIVFLLAFVGVMQLVFFWPVLARRFSRTLEDAAVNKKQVVVTFVAAALLLVALLGVMIPSALIGDSPAEFINLSNFVNPLSYVGHNTLLYIGLLLVWVGVYFFLLGDSGKSVLAFALWCIAGVCLVDYLFFGNDYGIIGSDLHFESAPDPGRAAMVKNLAAIAGVLVAEILVWKYKRSLVNPILVIATCAVLGVSAPNIMNIRQTVNEMLGSEEAQSEAGNHSLVDEEGNPLPLFNLSRNGRNVVILFMDRSIGTLVPYIMQEKPELAEQFQGFTYYKNTISYGSYTVFGSPALYGGYEYTPSEMNYRANELMRDKHNEALKVLPALFSDAGFNVTMTDPAYVDYKNNTYDYSTLTSISDNVDVYHTIGAYTQSLYPDYVEAANEFMPRSFVYYSIFKCAPVATQKIIYNKGNYLAAAGDATELMDFLDNYSVVEQLDKLANITDDSSDNLFFLHNLMTHCPVRLQLPNYEPSFNVDNSKYDIRNRQAEGMQDIYLRTRRQVNSYHVNMSFLLHLGDWFDYLREQGVYDNTRIIVVSDHGARGLWLIDDLKFNPEDRRADGMRFNPLFMVKDFGADGEFTTSMEFMTNADAPLIALEGIVDNPVNPYTGKSLDDSEKTSHPQIITTSMRWNQRLIYDDTTYLNTRDNWYSVQGNIYDKNNWKIEEDPLVYVNKE